jgi:hypothetical protein
MLTNQSSRPLRRRLIEALYGFCTSVNTVELQGGCSCGDIRYQLSNAPLFVHACHCLNCQKFCNSAFGITAIVLQCDVALTEGDLVQLVMPSGRSRWQCASCGESIYVTSPSHPATALLRPGSLDRVGGLTIDAHIWVKRKQDWISLPNKVPQFDEGYDRNEVWPQVSLERFEQAKKRSAI